MSRHATQPAAPSKSRWLVPLGAGVVVGVLAATVVLMNLDRSPADEALAEADDTPPEMVRIEGGTFAMGNDAGAPDEKPAHEVTVRGFLMDKTEVTNGQFAAF